MERILDDKTATESKTLIGHSGPIYGASFNYDNSLLLTSSEDKTSKLIHEIFHLTCLVFFTATFNFFRFLFGCRCAVEVTTR